MKNHCCLLPHPTEHNWHYSEFISLETQLHSNKHMDKSMLQTCKSNIVIYCKHEQENTANSPLILICKADHGQNKNSIKSEHGRFTLFGQVCNSLSNRFPVWWTRTFRSRRFSIPNQWWSKRMWWTSSREFHRCNMTGRLGWWFFKCNPLWLGRFCRWFSFTNSISFALMWCCQRLPKQGQYENNFFHSKCLGQNM